MRQTSLLPLPICQMKEKYKGIPLLAIRAASGTGKTTLLTNIIPLLKAKGVNVGCIKHTHHSLTLDTKGKDSFKLKEAGVNQVLVGDSQEWALFGTSAKKNNTLENMLSYFDHEELDLILVEGYKDAELQNIVLHRSEMPRDISELIDKNTIAIASNHNEELNYSVPSLSLDNHPQVTNFIIKRCLNKKFSGDLS